MRISVKRTNGIVVFICMLLLLLPMSAFAQNKVVVIPLFGGADSKPLKNIVTVAKAGGMYTDPVEAVNSIIGASKTNPYLVVIGPGEYIVASPVVMKPYVDITGSGENITRIKGAISTGDVSSSASIRGAIHCALSFLTVENTGGGTHSIALYNSSAETRVSNVTAIASGGTGSYGVYNSSSSSVMTDVTTIASGGAGSYGVYNISSSPVMTHVSATAAGGTDAIGVYNDSSPSVMFNVTATASGGTSNRGVFNYSSSPVMAHVTATATGGTESAGVYNSSSSPVMTDVTATATGGTSSYGFQGYDSSAKIRRCTLSGDTDGLWANNGTITVSQSTIINGVGGTGTKTCVACDNGTGDALTESCL